MTTDPRTPRLRLTPYRPADEEDFTALFLDERVARWMGSGPQPEAEVRALFRRVFDEVYAEQLFDVWAVRRPDGSYAGHAEIKPTEQTGGHEIVYALARDSWGQGLGTELAEALVSYGFRELGLSAVHATVAESNTASLKLLDRIGFEHVRDIRESDGSTTRVLTCLPGSRPAG